LQILKPNPAAFFDLQSEINNLKFAVTSVLPSPGLRCVPQRLLWLNLLIAWKS
jgi:hypothetical protein